MQAEIEALFDAGPDEYEEAHFSLFQSFKEALSRGEVRAAEPDPAAPTGWRVNGWVKKGILLGFRMGALVDMSIDPIRQPLLDKAAYPAKRITPEMGIRIVPGGSSIRDGWFDFFHAGYGVSFLCFGVPACWLVFLERDTAAVS